MYKPISTRAHGILDYLTIATFLTLPRVMGWSRGLTQGMTMLALGKLGYTLFTRHELGLVKKLPMQAHLALDAAGGAALCAMPTLLGDEDDEFAQEAWPNFTRRKSIVPNRPCGSHRGRYRSSRIGRSVTGEVQQTATPGTRISRKGAD